MNWIDYRRHEPLLFKRDVIPPLPRRVIVDMPLTDRQTIKEMALNIAANPYILNEQEEFVKAAKLIVRNLSKDFVKSVKRELDSGFGAVLVKELPKDVNLPTTPTVGGALPPGTKKTFVAEATLLVLGILTGAEPFNFRQEGRGKAPLIDNIVPIPSLKSQKGAGGFDNNFPFHCESAWHRMRPNYLILLGVREAPDAKTLVFSTEMLKDTSWVADAQKWNRSFRLKAPDLYAQMETLGIPMGTDKYAVKSPIELVDGTITLHINFNGTDCASAEALKWLAALEAFIEQTAVGTVLSTGTALILNNYSTCHTRTGYSPSFNGADRWFLRGYFKNDLWSEINETNDNNKAIPSKDFSEMMSLGWITSAGELTKAFSKFVHFPEEAQKLSGREAELSKIAFQLTPIQGSRIV
jgi:hypothetical protein